MIHTPCPTLHREVGRYLALCDEVRPTAWRTEDEEVGPIQLEEVTPAMPESFGQTWVYIENTPGYLPDDADPATLDSLDEAKRYLQEQVTEYIEHLLETGMEPNVSWDDDKEDCFISSSPTDLGRVFTIAIVEDE